MKFSKDGRYLAAGGQDKIVRVWQVISSKEEREAHEKEEDAFGSGGIYSGGRGVRLNAPVFRSEPTHEYTGHTADVLDLSWSKVRNFKVLVCETRRRPIRHFNHGLLEALNGWYGCELDLTK